MEHSGKFEIFRESADDIKCKNPNCDEMKSKIVYNKSSQRRLLVCPKCGMIKYCTATDKDIFDSFYLLLRMDHIVHEKDLDRINQKCKELYIRDEDRNRGMLYCLIIYDGFTYTFKSNQVEFQLRFVGNCDLSHEAL